MSKRMGRASWIRTAGVLVVGVLVVAGLVVGPGRGVPARLLSSGVVYLGSVSEAGSGQVGVVDAMTGRELESVDLGLVGEFEVVGGWRDGFGVDRGSGRVWRVDGRSLRNEGEMSVGPADEGLRVVSARDAVFVVRPGRAVIEVVDAVSMTTVEVPMEGVGDVVAGGDDRVFVAVDDRVGSVATGGAVRTGAPVGVGEGARLVVAGGGPLLVDRLGETMVAVDSRSLRGGAGLEGPGAGEYVVGTEGGWVFAVDRVGLTVTATSVTAGGRRQFGLEGATALGRPVASDQLVYVPGALLDGAPAVWIVDPEADRSVAATPLEDAIGDVSLDVQQGRVWWTDGSTAGRGAIGADGSTTSVTPLGGGTAEVTCTYAGSPVVGSALTWGAERADGRAVQQVAWEFQGDVEGESRSREPNPTVTWREPGEQRVGITADALSTVCTIVINPADDVAAPTTQAAPTDGGTTPSSPTNAGTTPSAPTTRTTTRPPAFPTTTATPRSSPTTTTSTTSTTTTTTIPATTPPLRQVTLSVSGFPWHVESADGSINCPPSCAPSVPTGTVVTLRAPQPGANVTFAGGCNGHNSCEFTANSDTAVTATGVAAVIPPLGGKTVAEAEAILEGISLSLGSQRARPLSQADGTIVEQDPPPSTPASQPGDPVNVVVSSGRPSLAPTCSFSRLFGPGGGGVGGTCSVLQDMANDASIDLAGVTYRWAITWPELQGPGISCETGEPCPVPPNCQSAGQDSLSGQVTPTFPYREELTAAVTVTLSDGTRLPTSQAEVRVAGEIFSICG